MANTLEAPQLNTRVVLHELRRPYRDCPLPVADENINLLTLFQQVSGFAAGLSYHTHGSLRLQSIASFAMRWACDNFDQARDLVAQERLRQRTLFNLGKHAFSVDDPHVDQRRKLRVLIEEVGEVAQAIDMIELDPSRIVARQHLVEELIQVAAVCVAWIEARNKEQ